MSWSYNTLLDFFISVAVISVITKPSLFQGTFGWAEVWFVIKCMDGWITFTQSSDSLMVFYPTINVLLLNQVWISSSSLRRKFFILCILQIVTLTCIFITQRISQGLYNSILLPPFNILPYGTIFKMIHRHYKIQALLLSCQKDTEDNVLTCSGANLNANVLTW